MTTEPPINGHSSGGHFGRMARLAMKEMRETLRDRRTIVTLVLMPLLVYPLLGVAFQRFLVTSLKPKSEPAYLIGVESEEAKKIVTHFLMVGELQLKQRRDRKADEARRTGRKPRKEDSRRAEPRPVDNLPAVRDAMRFQVDVAQDLDAAVASGVFDVGIRVPKDASFESSKEVFDPNSRIWMELLHRERSGYSEKALQFVEQRLDALNDFVRVKRLERRHIPEHIVPAHPYRKAVGATGAGPAVSIAALIPLILILMTITGAVYPAIDLTAGERERGTLEMLVAAPVPRMGLLLAKYVTVLTVAVLTATVNLVSMTVTVLATGLGPLLFGDDGLGAVVVVQIFGLMVLFAMFFSAVLLAVTSFARSFKEAQAYLIPLMLVSIAPGVFSMMPDLELSGVLIVTPLANIVLLARDLMQGTAGAAAAVIVVTSTMLYALAAIMVAARIFGTDAILYGSTGSWSELFRRPDEKSPACTPMAAVLALAVAFPLTFLSSQFAVRELHALPAAMLIASAIITALVFAGVPLLLLAARNVELRTAMSLRHASPLSLAAAALLGVSLWPFAFEMLLLIERLGIVSFDESFLAQAREIVARLRAAPVPLVYLSLAVIPAVCEELFFRGMFLSAMRSRTRTADWQAIVVSSLAFAAFHVIVRDTLSIERFFPSFFLGLVLGWVCVRTGSLFPGMLLHVVNNAALLSLAVHQETLKEWDFAAALEQHLPWWVLLAALVIAAAGFALLHYGVVEDDVCVSEK
jgi:ABC-2 type transport system permease protein/sodium transport system permease protein